MNGFERGSMSHYLLRNKGTPALPLVRMPGLICLVALLSACQTTPRPFDGTLGYTVEQQDGQWQVSVTDEAVRSWEALESQALQACARETGQSIEKLRLAARERSEFARNVPVPVSYPAGVIMTPTGGNNGTMTMAEAPQTFNQTEQVIRPMTFRRISGVCQPV